MKTKATKATKATKVSESTEVVEIVTEQCKTKEASEVDTTAIAEHLGIEVEGGHVLTIDGLKAAIEAKFSLAVTHTGNEGHNQSMGDVRRNLAKYEGTIGYLVHVKGHVLFLDEWAGTMLDTEPRRFDRRAVIDAWAVTEKGKEMTLIPAKPVKVKKVKGELGLKERIAFDQMMKSPTLFTTKQIATVELAIHAAAGVLSTMERKGFVIRGAKKGEWAVSASGMALSARIGELAV